MKKTCIALPVLAIVVLAGIGSSNAQAPADKVVRLDAALDALISVDAKIEKVASGFGFTEGPVWVQRGREGYLLFTDTHAELRYRAVPDRYLAFPDFALDRRRWGASHAEYLSDARSSVNRAWR